MDFDPKIAKFQTSDPTSFAYITVRKRWPNILTGAIDDVHRAVGEVEASNNDKIKDGKSIVEQLAKLKYELQHNRQLSRLEDDDEADVESYNAELKARGDPTWHNVEWLYSECYLYRRISSLFRRSKHWKSYDVFGRQKMSTFKSSRPAVLELATKYKAIVEQTRQKSTIVSSNEPTEIEEAEKVLFMEMCEICLWGNATDLSLLTSLSYEDIQKLQGANARKESEKNILVNDLPAAFATLQKAKKAGRKSRVSIVLDNAGFELFVDLILAGFLLTGGLASEVILHPKSIPWFVSDVVPKDFVDLLNVMADPQAFYATDIGTSSDTTPMPLMEEEVGNLRFLFDNWSNLHREGKLLLRPSRFWTHPGSFWRMPHTAPEVLEDLKESELVIFKGDLNYRKLTGDAAWDPTAPFADSLGPLGKGSGVRSLALRTCKADVVVGLPPGRDEELRHTEGGGGDSGARKWAWSGKWALVQLCDGKI
ncbi:hypothetical protein EPUS_01111 [Endocarpon pusillum Z07020]|uniref:Sugar phosphate phosphatase n=1 Tax=Endocarpon pusillum (strain Z07020 / HMAS-L-300199) TaxID=1263415 RepID=U1HGB9_ENDPU|nr:uncharacterized protein EPUS_01111 [Endocarpon pusillum Z07020]ERF69155.1 hypothetical protein EPUS_01111 [Endocarpon pusillum Z07020]